MHQEISFAAGQPLQLKSVAPQTSGELSSRVLSTTDHTVTVSIPYHKGRIILWPVGSKLEITLDRENDGYTFNTEIINRDLGEIKSYTFMRPQAISRTATRTVNEGMSRVIAVTSGKGGVGKTTIAINLAIALAAQNKKVFIIDADLGTANIDVLLRLAPKYNITHLLSGDKTLLDIATPAPGNIAVIPGGSGLQSLTQMSESQFSHIIGSFNQLDGLADFILLDTGAGISRDVSNFLLAADETIVVTTPEPHAITDAYAIMKVMHNLGCEGKRMLVVNRAENRQEADLAASRLKAVISRYLGRETEYLGYIQEDAVVGRSLKQQNPFLIANPQSAPARNVSAIAARLLNLPDPKPAGITGFINKMFSLVKTKSAGTPSL